VADTSAGTSPGTVPPSQELTGPPLAELSLLALVQNHTLDLPLAALFWALAARRSSLIVASPPRLAGKSTLLHAILDLQPPGCQFIATRGRDEDFGFLATSEPTRTTILVNEFSDHLPRYLWGEGVAQVFAALAQGYSLGATMHAATAEQVLSELAAAPNSVPPGHLGQLAAIVTIAMRRGERGPVRRVETVALVEPPTTSSDLPPLQPLARWDPKDDSFHLDGSAQGRARTAARLGLAPAAWERELSRRGAALQALLERGVTEPDRVRREAWRALPV